MTTSFVEPVVSIKFEISSAALSEKELHLVFKTSPDKPALGEAGAKAGATNLIDPATALVSLGKAGKLSSESFRQAGGGLAKWIAQNQVVRIHLDVASLNSLGIAGDVPALLEGLLLGSFRFDRYKKTDETPVCVIVLHSQQAAVLEKIVERSQKICAAVNMARDWEHEPANVIDPITLAGRAQALAAQYGLRCTVLDDQQLESMGAGAIVAVGRGSVTPARLIILEYAGNNPPASAKPVVLVGKDFDVSRAEAEKAAVEKKARYVSSGDEPLLIAGVGTVTLEIVEDIPDLDYLFVPVGGGSCASGAATVVKTICPRTKVIGVQAEAAPAVYRSWKTRSTVVTDRAVTFADGLATRAPFALPLRIMIRLLDDMMLVSEDEIRQAIMAYAEYAHVVAEGAGAAPLAAARKMGAALKGKKVGLILSGGNLTLDMLKSVFK